MRPRRWVPTGAGQARRADSGAGSVLVVALVGVGLVLASATAVLGQVGVAVARAGAAADLAALAAADVVLGRASAGDPCAAASRVAAAHGAVLTGCAVGAGAGEVGVGVEVALGGVVAAVGPVRAQARAGSGLVVPGAVDPVSAPRADPIAAVPRWASRP